MFKFVSILLFIVMISAQQPNPAQNVQADSLIHQNVITWDAPIGGDGGVLNYIIRRTDGADLLNNLADSSNSNIIATIPVGGERSFTDTDVVGGFLYHYYVIVQDTTLGVSNYGPGDYIYALNQFTEIIDPLDYSYNMNDFEFFDLDQDGDMDIVVTGYNLDSSLTRIDIYEYDGEGFSSIFSLEDYNGASIDVYDMDGDTYVDVIVSGYLGNPGKRKRGSGYATEILINNRDGSFSIQDATGMPGVDNGFVGVGDFNNDGAADILLVGDTGDEVDQTLIYFNKGSYTFELDTNIGDLGDLGDFTDGYNDPDVEIIDMDNNGLLDIALQDRYEDNNIVFLTQQDTGFHLVTDITHNLYLYYGSRFDIADIDNDGDYDVVGDEMGEGSSIRVFLNNGDMTFSNLYTNYDFYWYTDWDIKFVDFDNDGDMDFVQTIFDAGGEFKGNEKRPIFLPPGEQQTKFYRNIGDDFEEVEQEFHEGFANSKIIPIDIDIDGDMDIFIMGDQDFIIPEKNQQKGIDDNFSFILMNQLNSVNAKPLTPVIETITSDNSSHSFNWSASSDPESGVNGVNYNIGLFHESFFPITPNALPTGELSIISKGKSFKNTSFTLNDSLPDGYYTFFVHATDHNNQGSAPASQVFRVDRTPPEPATNLQYTPGKYYVDLTWDASVSLDVEYYEIYVNDYESPDGAYYVGDVSGSTFMFTDSNAYSNYDLFYYVQAVDSAGLTAWSEVQPVNFVGHFEITVDSNLSADTYSETLRAWGDYDNDGDLDLALAAYNEDEENPELSLFKNDGTGNFTFDQTLSTTLGIPSLDFTDYDNDGDVDLVVYASEEGGEFKAPGDTYIAVFYNTAGSFSQTIIREISTLFPLGQKVTDMNNDGIADVLIGGFTQQFTPYINIYHGDGEGNLIFIDSIPNRMAWKIESVHMNDDDFIDFVIYDDYNSDLLIMLHNDTGYQILTESDHGIRPDYSEVYDVADMDDDGDYDILITQDNEGLEQSVFENLGNNTFNRIVLTYSFNDTRSGRFIDFDNDGDLDVIISDYEGGQLRKTEQPYINVPDQDQRTMIYINTGSGFEELEQDFMTGYGYAQIDIVDFDNDGDSDILLFGEQGGGLEGPAKQNTRSENKPQNGSNYLPPNLRKKQHFKQGTNDYFDVKYINLTPNLNSAPSIPVNVTVDNEIRTTRFFWDPSTDDHSTQSIHYNLKLRDLIANKWIVSSATAFQYPKTITRGNVGNRTEFTLNDSLPDGEYRIRVQAIDQNNTGSDFSQVLDFNIDRSPPAPPTNVMIASDLHTLTLTWTLSDSTDVVAYDIYRYDDIDSTQAEIVATVGGTTTMYVDSTHSGETYYYWLKAIDEADNESDWTTNVSGASDSQFDINVDPISTTYGAIFNIHRTDWADIDGDGDYDLAVSSINVDSGYVSEIALWKNDGSGNMTFHDKLAMDVGLADVNFADFDNDGDVDIIIIGEDGGVIPGPEKQAPEDLFVGVAMNDGNGNFTTDGLDIFGSNGGMVRSADLNNDGLIDFAIAGPNSEEGFDLRTYINEGEWNFSLRDSVAGPNDGIYGFEIADMDNDGKSEVLLLSAEELIIFTFEDSGIQLLTPEDHDIDLQYSFDGFDLGDYDSDGDLDLVGTVNYSPGDEVLIIYENDGDLTFTKSFEAPTGSFSLHPAWIDYDNDGDLDLVMTSYYGGGEGPPQEAKGPEHSPLMFGERTYFVENNEGVFTPMEYELHEGLSFTALDIVDIDGDADMDIFMMGSAQPFEFKTNPTFETFKNMPPISQKTEQQKGLDSYFNAIFINNSETTNDAPNAPSNLDAIISDTKIDFMWDSTTDAQQDQNSIRYNLRLGSIGEPNETRTSQSSLSGFHRTFNFAQTTTNTSFSLNDSVPDGEYVWSVQAIDFNNVASGFESTGNFRVDHIPPAVITGLNIIQGDGELNISWDQNADSDFLHYIIFDENLGQPIDTITNQTTTTFTYSGLTNYQDYEISVAAEDIANLVGPKATSTTFPIDLTPPEAPENIVVTNGDMQATIDWDDNAEGDLDNYRVVLASDGSPVDTVSVSNVTLTGLLNYTTYEYRVVAVDTSGNESEASEIATVYPTDMTPPDAPSDLAISEIGHEYITVTWTKNSEGDMYEYNIYLSDDGESFTLNTNIDHDDPAETTMSALTNGTEYTIRISAVDTSGNESSFSTPVSGTPFNSPPFVQNNISDLNFNEDFDTYKIYIANVFDDIDNDELTIIHGLDESAQIAVSISDDTLYISSILNANGVFELLLHANDGFNSQVNDTIIVSVNPVNDFPVVDNPISDQNLDEDFDAFAFDLTSIFSDIEELSADLQFSATGLGVVDISVNNLSDLMTISSISNSSGIDTVVITAMDSQSGFVRDTVLINVEMVNDPPIVDVEIADPVLEEDFATFNIDAEEIFEDVETTDENMIYTASSASGLFDVSISSGSTVEVSSILNSNGTDTLYITAQDEGGLTVQDVIVMTINAVNDQPFIDNALPDQALDEDFESVQFDLNNTFQDVDNDDTEFTYSNSNPDLVTIDITNGILTVSSIADFEGLDTLYVTATDPGALGVTDTMYIAINMINDAPIVEAPESDITVDEDFADFTIDGTAIFSDIETSDENFIYGLNDENLVTVSIEDGIYTISSIADVFGTDTLILSARDEGFEYVYDTVIVTINPINDAPVVENEIVNQAYDEDFEPVQIDLYDVFADVDDEQNDLSFSNGDHSLVGLNIVDNILTISSNANVFGSETIVITATDDDGLSVTDTVDIQITSVNDLPFAENPLEDITVDEDFETFQIDMRDIFADVETSDENLLYSFENTEGIIDVSYEDGILTVNSILNVNGVDTIYMAARDESFEYAYDKVTVTVNPVNDAPYVDEALANIELDEDFEETSMDVSDVFHDIDSEFSVSIASLNGDSIVNVSLVDQELTISSISNLNGSEAFVLTADDGEFTETDTFIVNVNPINDLPFFNAQAADQSFEEDFEDTFVDFSDLVSDIDNSDNELSLEIHGANLLEVGAEGLLVRYRSIENVFGTDTIIFNVFDEDGSYSNAGTDTVLITISSVDDGPMIVNAIDDVDVDEDFESFNIDVSSVFSDGDSDYQLSIATDDSGVLNGSLADGEITFTANEHAFGTQSFYLTASSIAKNELSVTDTFVVVVNSVNDAPASEDFALNVNEDTELTIGLDLFKSAYSDTVENDTLNSIKITTLPEHGTLYQDGETVQDDDEIDVEDFNLTYIGNRDFYGEDAFGFRVFDGDDLSKQDAKVELAIIPVVEPVELLSIIQGDGSLALTWSQSDEGDISSYSVIMNTINDNSEGAEVIASTSDTTVTVSDLDNYTTYFFWIVTIDEGENESDFSNSLNSFPTDQTAPGAPTNVQALPGDASAIVSWSFDDVDELANFKVFGGTNQDNLTLMGTQTTPATRSLTITGLTNGLQYFFKVNATDTAGNEGEQSAVATVTPEALEINLALLQNQLVNRNATVQVLASLELINNPTVQVVDVFDQPTAVPMSSDDNLHYRGIFDFPTEGTYRIRIFAETSNNREAELEQTYTLTTVNAKVAAKIQTVHGKANYSLPKHAIVGVGTAISTYDEDKNIHEIHINRELKKDMRVELPYDVDVFADASKLFIYQEVDGKWEALPTQVFTKKTSVVAYTRESGRFLVAFDELFDGSNIVPEDFALSQNYPNPFNPTTSIKYDLAKDVNVSIVIFNTLGQKVRTLVREFQRAGSAKVATWNARNDRGERVASGIYFYQLQAGNKIITKKMVLIK
jgi:chitodextrinase